MKIDKDMGIRSILVLILAIGFIFSIAGLSFAESNIYDIERIVPNETSTYQTAMVDGSEAINNMNRLGIMNNYPDGTFMPNNTISRAELAKILCILTDLDDMVVNLSGKSGPYLDVSTEHWANGYTYAAFIKKYIEGDANGYFHPDMGITHAEVITILLRIIGYNDNLPGEWPSNYIAKAANLGILDDVYFITDKDVTRGELAIMINEILYQPIVKYSSSDNSFQNDLVFNKSIGKNIVRNLLMDNFLWDSNGFLDVDYNSIEGRAIDNINHLGIIDGYPDKTFGADKNMTNAEFSKLVCIITGFKTADEGMADTPSSFTDVSIDHWANGWINVAAAQGFMTGDTSGSFRPDECLKQAEAVTVLLRAIGYNDHLTGDSPSNYIAKAANLGILDDIYFVSSRNITRGELAILINEIIYLPIVRYITRDDLFMYDEKYNDLLGGKFYHTLFGDHYGWAGFAYAITDGKATITKYTEPYKILAIPLNIAIPNSLDGYPVTTIGGDAFNACTALTRVGIPQSVISVGERAFSYCSNLESVRFNSAVTEIYDSEYTIPNITKIIGYNPSTSKDYAIKYNRAFETLAAPTLQYISITAPAAKLNYTVGDKLDITGLEVTGTYSDNSTKIESITTENINGFDSSTPATEQVLIVKIGNKTTTYTVRVSAQQQDECFIATAAFGSKFEPAVVLLRHFRDQFLLTNKLGTAFVGFYYHNSPPVAAYIANSEPLKVFVRLLLIPIIAVVYSFMHPIVGVGCIIFLGLILAIRKRKINKIRV